MRSKIILILMILVLFSVLAVNDYLYNFAPVRYIDRLRYPTVNLEELVNNKEKYASSYVIVTGNYVDFIDKGIYCAPGGERGYAYAADLSESEYERIFAYKWGLESESGSIPVKIGKYNDQAFPKNAGNGKEMKILVFVVSVPENPDTCGNDLFLELQNEHLYGIKSTPLKPF